MNVIKISTTPIRLSMSSQRARLEAEIPNPQVGIDVTPGKLSMNSSNIKANIDTFDARHSQGFRTAKGLMQDAAAAGQQAASEATAEYARIGNQLSQIQTGATVADIMKNYFMPSFDYGNLTLVSTAAPNINWEANQLDMQYTPAHVDYTPEPDMQGGATYVPGNLDINVEQYPKVEIEYVGGPLYVPPSAAPDYEEE